MLPRVFGPKEGQLSELDEDVEEDDSPPVAEIAEIDFGNEPTDGSEVVRDSTKGKTPVVDSTLTVVQSPDVKGQSTVGENGESSKDKTLFLRKSRASKVILEKPPEEMTKHLRPLYIKAHISGKPVSRVLVDNGAAVNILPLRMVRRLSKSEQDLIPSEVSVTSFYGSNERNHSSGFNSGQHHQG